VCCAQVHGGANGHLGSVHAKGLHTTASDASTRKGVNGANGANGVHGAHGVQAVGGDVPVRGLRGAASVGVAGAVASISNGQHLAGKVIDPFRLMEPQLKALTENLRDLVASDNNVLHNVARYFFDQPGKRFRPALVLLVAQASPPSGAVSIEQQRLAEITEMIHTASLLHDDVMDHAEVRRGIPALNSVHGNKLAILAGDFLLSRASLNLARLKNVEVIELLSTVIAHLVEGEIMQSRTEAKEATNLDYYMRKTYLKTASLLAHSCEGVVLLGKGDEAETLRASKVAFEYGKHLGMAFQLQDDVLDFEGDLATLGKTPGSDLREGLTTAPVLFALEQFPGELGAMIERNYKGPGDVERAMELVKMSGGLARSKELALHHSALAIESANKFDASPARDALIQLANMVVSRKA
jgi:solanesyl diphosphate synthase